MKESATYHSELFETVQKALQSRKKLDPSAFPKGFIFPAGVFRTAWDAASQTGVLSQLDYPLILELSKIYAQQERYEQQVKSSGELIYEELFRTGTFELAANARRLLPLIGAMRYRELEFDALYDDGLRAVEGALAP